MSQNVFEIKGTMKRADHFRQMDDVLKAQNLKVAAALQPTHCEWRCRTCGTTTFLTAAGGNLNDCADSCPTEGRDFDIRMFVLAKETTMSAMFVGKVA